MEHTTTSTSSRDVAAADWPAPAAELVPLTAAGAVEQLAADTGRSTETARAMIRDYLDDTSAALGASVHRWGLASGDVAEIRRGYEWVDYESGETATAGRARAAAWAEQWAERAQMADRGYSPGHTARVDKMAALWAARAHDPREPVDVVDLPEGDEAGTAPDPIDQARDAVAALPTAAAVLDADPSEWPDAAADHADGHDGTEEAGAGSRWSQ
jgi:hypothetical protein